MIDLTEDEAREISERAEKHLDLCWEAMLDEESKSPAFAPFCGCTTCVVREVLMAALMGDAE